MLFREREVEGLMFMFSFFQIHQKVLKKKTLMVAVSAILDPT